MSKTTFNLSTFSVVNFLQYFFQNTTLVFFMEPNGHADMSSDGVLMIRSLRDEAVTQFDVRVSDGREDEADAKSTAIVLNVILKKGTTDHVVHFYRPQIAMLLSSSQAERKDLNIFYSYS